ncbi:KRAB-A domain-containing protein 2-like [Mytilus edulis]|uniref:KRAB-A domain-containing protein 2-like n=1 Tax=Mytilus edulis TaxID=6550 RepID=UPI0039F13D91
MVITDLLLQVNGNMSSWEDNFQIFLNELLQKKSTVLLTDEKVERIKSLIIDTKDGQKTDTPRFRQYVKDKGFQLVTCAVLGLENELCVPTKEECERPGLLAHWRRVVTVENMFKTLKLVHEGTRSHTGYHKLFKDVEDTFYGVPRSLCKEFIKGCVKCACKKPQNNIAPLKPISSKHFMHRGQLDLVDKRADPDGPFCWIGHYIDHFSKFNFFWPQERKSAIEVAHNLKVNIFSVIGLPFILQHDNGREFCNNIIRETIKIWPGGNVKIITGRPRHPRTQGLVEQVHNSLHRLLAAKRSENPGSGWLEHLYEVQYSLNTQHHSSIKVTPYEAVFGQKANDGVFVGTNATDEFINKEAIEMFISEDIPTDIDSQTDNDSQTDHDSVAKRRRLDIEADIDCIILHDLLTEETDTVSETLSLTSVDSTHDKIRQIVEKNYKHSVQNTMHFG